MKVDHSKKLAEFTEYLKTFPEIIGIAYTGSTATASWDEYSDIDVDIVTKDKDYKKIVKKIPKLMEFWGEVKFWNPYETWDETYAFVGENYFKIEIEPISLSYFNKPHLDLKNIKVLYDPTGKIAKGKRISQKLKFLHLDDKYFRWNLLENRSNLFYAVRHYLRGQLFEGISNLDDIRGDLFKVLARTKGIEDWDLYRTAEKNLIKKEFDLWKSCRTKSNKKSEVKRVVKNCWKFMKYIEKKYEKVSGKELDLGTNDKEIFDRLMGELK